MNMFRLSMICTVAAGLAACTSGVPDATRNLPINEATGRTLAVSQSSAGTGDQSAGYSIVEPRYDVVAVNVDVHVNEQSGLSLWRACRAAGFTVKKVWLDSPPQNRTENKALAAARVVLFKWPPFRWFFEREVFTVAVKP